MTDPIVTVATAEILKLAFNEFIKTGAGETAKQLTGEALTKVGELRDKIVSWFKDKQNTKAETAIVELETEGSQKALNRLEIYLDDAMEDDSVFAKELKLLFQETQELSNTLQKVATHIKAGGDVEVEGIEQDASSRKGTTEQTVGENIESTQKVSFKDIKQKG
jgi:hypothetical protein